MDTPHAHRNLRRAAALFVAIGVALYIALVAAADALVYANGASNPLYRIATLERPQDDWVVLGASHAMPLAFGGIGGEIEAKTGARISNLAATGAGPLYNRFVLEQYLRGHRTANVLYVADSFAFYSRQWNEERFADAKLLGRTPWKPATSAALARYVADEGVDWRAWLDYSTGFSKVNNHDRFKADRWEGEAQFEREWRPSSSSVKKRIEYLYRDGMQPAALAHHLAQLQRLVAVARASGARVVIVKLPVPAGYKAQLPDEAAFDAAMAAFAATNGATWRDLSGAFDEPKYFFDSDHLNRAGVQALLAGELKALLAAPPVTP